MAILSVRPEKFRVREEGGGRSLVCDVVTSKLVAGEEGGRESGRASENY